MTDLTSPQTNIPPRKKNKLFGWLFVVMAILGVCSCLCIGYVLVSIAYSLNTQMRGTAEITPVLKDYMQKMSNRDFQSAAEIFIPEKRQEVYNSTKDMSDEFFTIFEGYQDLTISNFVLAIRTDPSEKFTSKVTGRIDYEGGFTGSFSAILQYVDNEWKIDSIEIVVPPEKFSK